MKNRNQSRKKTTRRNKKSLDFGKLENRKLMAGLKQSARGLNYGRLHPGHPASPNMEGVPKGVFAKTMLGDAYRQNCHHRFSRIIPCRATSSCVSSES